MTMKNTNRSQAASKAQKPSRAPFETHADIVANAKVSDYFPTLVDVSTPNARAVLVAAAKRGSRLVSINWITGEFALALCKPGTSVPTDENIVIAYQACQSGRDTQGKGITL